ncbi:MAG: helix-turn-helix domain-containing protein, partial [Lachnospiraceae bacterium]|nr:helix-turn-helix domain-containing protein [Lachnospiraceae bacterium]
QTLQYEETLAVLIGGNQINNYKGDVLLMLDQYNDVLTVAELQEILGVGRNLVYALLQSGTISAFRVGQKKWRIPKAAVLSYLAQYSL